MHVKQRIIAVLALVCFTGAAIVFGSLKMAGESEQSAALSVFDRKETLYFWYSDDSLTGFFNYAAVSFGEERNVRVIPMLVDEGEYLEAVNQASLHSEHVPDVYMVNHNSLEKAYLAGLAGQIQDEEGVCTTENFPQTALFAVTYQDKLVAYPFSYETSALVYNETYLQEWAAQQAQKELDGTNEEEYEEEGEDTEPDGEEDGMGEADTEADEENGMDRSSMTLEELTMDYFGKAVPATVDDILYIGDTFDLPEGVEGIMKWDVSDIFYNYWFVGNYMTVGGDSGDDENNININSQEAISCLEVYQALNQFFSIESDTVTYDSVVQDFIDGKLVFTIATTDIIRTLEEAKEEGLLTYDYGIAVIPDVSSGLLSRSLSVTKAIAVNGYSDKKELANEFAAYLAGECSLELYERTGKVSANLAANRDNGAVQIFMEEYASSVPLTKMLSASNFWIQLEVLFSRVWNGSDISELVQELAQQMQLQTLQTPVG